MQSNWYLIKNAQNRQFYAKGTAAQIERYLQQLNTNNALKYTARKITDPHEEQFIEDNGDGIEL